MNTHLSDSADPDAAVLALRSLRFRYPGASHDTLDIPELTVAQHQRVLIKGDSGCGKSTLLSVSAGVLLATSGSVSLLGQDWSTLGAARRDARRVDHVGYIFQQFNLLPYLTVMENVLMPCRFSSLRAQRAREEHGSTRQAASLLLDALSLPERLWTRSASELSVGQQQRVAAARALIGHPEIVIADEPTSALDETRRDGFMRLLIDQCDKTGTALVFVSHDMRLSSWFNTVIDLPTLNRAATSNVGTRAEMEV